MRKFLIYILPVFIIAFVLMNVFRSDVSFIDQEDEIRYHKELKNNRELVKVYFELSKDSVFNYTYHYRFLDTYFRLYRSDSAKIGIPLDQILDQYNNLVNASEPELQNIGSWGFAFIYYYLNSPAQSFNFLQSIVPNSPYSNYLLGNYYYHYDWLKSNNYYDQELKLYPNHHVAFDKKTELLLYYSQFDSLDLMIQNPNNVIPLSNSIKRQVYFKKGNWSGYVSEVFNRFLVALNWNGFLGAFFILIIWFLYLTKLYQNELKIDFRIYLILLLGMLFAFMTSILSDFNKYVFYFNLNGALLNDFLYCVVGIGMIEELVKIIPLLLIIKIYPKKLQPIDYLIFASVSALGFAFIENIIYFDRGGIKTMQGRALTATVVHMFNSSIIAYGIIIGKYSKHKKTAIQFLIYFLIASVTHGFYDFWLINTQAVQFNFITFIWLLMSMMLWVSMINNCINNSFGKVDGWKYQPQKTNTFLLFGLSFVFLLEYLIVGIEYGAEVANFELQKDVTSGLFLLLFLTLSLSKFDYIPNYWAPLKFWDWDLMLSIPKTKHNYFNYNHIIGLKIRLKSYGYSSIFEKNQYITGVIIKRELLSWEKDWYLVRLDSPMDYGWNNYEFVLIKSKYANKPLHLDNVNSGAEVVKLRLVKNIDDLSNRIKRKRNYLLVDYVLLERLVESD